MFEHIYIIGAGAIGKALAVFLKAEGCNVTLIRGSVDEGEVYWENITVELLEGKQINAQLRIAPLCECKTLDGLVVLANKSYGNDRLASLLKNKIGDAPLVFMQNGLMIEQAFIDKGFKELYRCVVFATSQFKSTNLLSFRAVSASPIGKVLGGGKYLSAVVQSLTTNGFPFVTEEKILPVVWYKTIINCAFNSICPLLETDNGIFARNEQALSIAQQVIVECAEIGALHGLALDKDQILQGLLRISQYSDGQYISTYQDILHKRKTEIDTLNMSIAAMAKKMGKANRVRLTTLLGELIQLKSALH